MKRINPSKCNDGSYSSKGNKQGTCTWHRGVQEEVTSAEYRKSKLRVRYGTEKGYKGEFAPMLRAEVPQSKKATVNHAEETSLTDYRKAVKNGSYSLRNAVSQRGRKEYGLTLHVYDKKGNRKSDEVVMMRDLKTEANVRAYLKNTSQSEYDKLFMNLDVVTSDGFADDAFFAIDFNDPSFTQYVPKYIQKALQKLGILDTDSMIEFFKTLHAEDDSNEENARFEIDKKSFNEQYKTLQYSSNEALRRAIIDALVMMDVITMGMAMHLSEYNLTEVKAYVTDEVLPYWCDESLNLSEKEIGEVVNEFFTLVQGALGDYLQVDRPVPKVDLNADLYLQLIDLQDWAMQNDIYTIKGDNRLRWSEEMQKAIIPLLNEYADNLFAEHYHEFSNIVKGRENVEYSKYIRDFARNHLPEPKGMSTYGSLSSLINSNESHWIQLLKKRVQQLKQKMKKNEEKDYSSQYRTISSYIRKLKARRVKIYKLVQSTHEFKMIGGLAKFGSAKKETSLIDQMEQILPKVKFKSKMNEYDYLRVDQLADNARALLEKPIEINF